MYKKIKIFDEIKNKSLYLITCPDCNLPIQSQAHRCPYCATYIEKNLVGEN